MTRYAKNLIGDWETEQYEPLRQVAQAQYQTNWNKLTNDFNNLNEQLAQNFKNARIQHNDAILNSSRDAYSRMYNAEQNLANRGLTGSGLMNTYNAVNTKQTGQTNNALMEDLMNANKANMEGRIAGLDTYANNVAKLSGNLADELAGITDAEGDNARKYANLVSDLSESAAARAVQYGGGSEKEKELDRIYQLITINDILGDEETDDVTKYYELTTDALVSPEQAERILSSYNYNKTSDKAQETQRLLRKSQSNLDKYKNAHFVNMLTASLGPVPMAVRGTGYGITKLNEYNRKKKLDKLNKELNNYTYEDLKDIMGYKGF